MLPGQVRRLHKTILRCDIGVAAILREVIRATDPVLISAVGALLDGAGIAHVVLDRNMSVLDGSLGILPCRIVVSDEDVESAKRVLRDAGLGHELRPDVT